MAARTSSAGEVAQDRQVRHGDESSPPDGLAWRHVHAGSRGPIARRGPRRRPPGRTDRAIGTAPTSMATTRSSWPFAGPSGSACRRPATPSSWTRATASSCRPGRATTRVVGPAGVDLPGGPSRPAGSLRRRWRTAAPGTGEPAMTSETERADPTYPPATPTGGVDATQVEDGALVRAVAEGSHDALAVLYDRYVDSIFAVARRSTSDRGAAEEVVQETFLALWDRAETFDPAMGSVGGWLRAIARNRASTGCEPPLAVRRWCRIRWPSAPANRMPAHWTGSRRLAR